MDGQNLIRGLLVEQYEKAKQKNPSFSQRAFAKRLDLSSGAFSSIVNGKRNVSYGLAKDICNRLGIDVFLKDRILNKFDEKKHALLKKKSDKERVLGLDHFQIISKGIHFSLLSLLETKKFKNDPEYLAQIFNESVSEVKTALERLKRLGLIKVNETGELSCTYEEIASPDEVDSDYIKNSHIESIEQARDALFRTKIDERDYTSQTLAISRDKLVEAKELIRDFGNQFAALMDDDSGGEKDDVYKINIQFFPLTRNLL